MRCVILVLWMLGISYVSIGQDETIKVNYNPTKLYKLGKKAFEEGDYFLSNTYFEALKDKGFVTDERRFVYLQLLIKLNHYEQALELSNELEKNKFSHPLLHYYKATLLYSKGDKASAQDYISFFLKNKSNREEYKAQSSHLLTLKSNIDTGFRKGDSVFAYVYLMSKEINKSGAEFSPVIAKDGLIFGSQGMNKVNYYNQEHLLKGNIDGTRKIYQAKGKGVLLDSIELFPLQMDKKEISSFCFDRSYRVMYISACQFDEKLKKYICNIYQSKFKDKQWTEPELIPELNVLDYTSTHVNLGFDASRDVPVLYFSSDRPGGRGGMDIWYSFYNTRTLKFLIPRNIGAKINTPNDEITPYFHIPSNTLYFSSNGKGGYGGLDIFYSPVVNGLYSNVEHIEKEVNSPQDDVFYHPDKTLEKGYFVSNRYSENSLIHPHCCDDIYYFDKKAPPSNKTKIVVEATNKNKIPIQNIEYTISKIDTGKLTFVENGTGKNKVQIEELGKNTSYEIEIYSKGFFRKKILVEVKEDTLYYQKIELDSIDFNPIVLPLVEFDFDSFSLTPVARKIIDSLALPVLLSNPTLRIELGAHTDSRGDDMYNEQLSMKRAKAIRTFLIEHHNIDPRRLEYRGYGEHVPIAPNEYEDGRDFPDGRQKNRRCEFRILPDEFDPY